MPSVIDQGEMIVPEGERPDMTGEEVARAVDVIIVRLRVSGYKFREIAGILNRPPATIATRYHRMTPEARRYHETLSLG